MAGVYIIRCVPTGELYVGGTKQTFKERFDGHIDHLKVGKGPRLLQEAHDKHGLESLSFIPLKEFPPDQVAHYEREAIHRVKPALNIYRMPNPGISRQLKRYRKMHGLDPLKTPNKLGWVRDLAEQAGITMDAMKYRLSQGMTGDALIAPKHRAPRKPYTKNK